MRGVDFPKCQIKNPGGGKKEKKPACRGGPCSRKAGNKTSARAERKCCFDTGEKGISACLNPWQIASTPQANCLGYPWQIAIGSTTH